MLDPYPVLFEFGTITLYTHGLMFAIGVLAAYFYASLITRRFGIYDDRLVWLYLSGFASGIIGARIGYFLVYPRDYVSITDTMAFWNGGLLSYSGIIVGGLVVYGLVRSFWPDTFMDKADILALSAILGWGVGRIGNFLAGDSVGVVSSAWAITYNRIPIQLFESVVCFLIAFVGTWFLMRRRPNRGTIALSTGAAYFVARTVIDLWRDEPSLIIGLKPSVVTAAFLGAVLIAVIVRHATRAYKI